MQLNITFFLLRTNFIYSYFALFHIPNLNFLTVINQLKKCNIKYAIISALDICEKKIVVVYCEF